MVQRDSYDRPDVQLYVCSRPIFGMLLCFLCMTVLVATACLAVGQAFARYMTVATADMGFHVSAKPSVTASRPVVEGDTATFSVTCVGGAEHTDLRIRVYGFSEESQTLMVIRKNTDTEQTYVLSPRSLDAQTPAGQETNAVWVYVLTDGYGHEILFETTEEILNFELRSADADSDISKLQICVEAVKNDYTYG